MDYHVITNFEGKGGAELMLCRLLFQINEPCKVISLMGCSDELKSRLPNHVEVIALNATNALSMLFTVVKISSQVNKGDQIYSWMYHANVIAALVKLLLFCKVRLFWGVRHSLDDYDGEKRSTKMAIWAGRLLRNIPDKVIYCSNRAKKQHEKFGYSNKINSVYIPNGYFFPPVIEKSFYSNTIVFGTAGRFHDAKDYETLINAIAPILYDKPEAKLKMCGKGVTEDNSQLIEMLERAGINKHQVDLYGQVTDMSEFYNHVDLFILSSKTEGFPNVLAEAAAHGCAVFSTDVGDASVIVNNSTHIVPVADSIALTQVIENYLSLPSEQRKVIAFATTQHVRSQFSISHIAEQFFALGR
ncbi:glycosyl transferase [Vibrio rotiferianus]|uniref:Glycosyl transferase n=1 Tax=Vibrio rotiferianus TaxID=190895 RepID=A0A510I1W7_9VIBR|nr:glycosyltransferase [Vibrio rotiferianus]BBL87594.1 glycosyl transferase [Vibrio rotiferianus]